MLIFSWDTSAIQNPPTNFIDKFILIINPLQMNVNFFLGHQCKILRLYFICCAFFVLCFLVITLYAALFVYASFVPPQYEK